MECKEAWREERKSEGGDFQEERETVRKLRMKGVGTREILEQTHFSKEEINQYCRELGLPLEGSCYLLPLSPEEETWMSGDGKGALPSQLCPQCGRRLIHNMRGRRKRFCSEECRYQWWNKHREPRKQKDAREAVCEHCKSVFIAFNEYRNVRRYCSRECYYQGRWGSGKQTQ